jgi:hypothetical protein
MTTSTITAQKKGDPQHYVEGRIVRLFAPPNISLSLAIYIYIYIYICKNMLSINSKLSFTKKGVGIWYVVVCIYYVFYTFIYLWLYNISKNNVAKSINSFSLCCIDNMNISYILIENQGCFIDLIEKHLISIYFG